MQIGLASPLVEVFCVILKDVSAGINKLNLAALFSMGSHQFIKVRGSVIFGFCKFGAEFFQVFSRNNKHLIVSIIVVVERDKAPGFHPANVSPISSALA